MGLSHKRKHRLVVLNLLLEGFWDDFSNPNFYNIVGIKCCPHFHLTGLFLGIQSENGNGFFGRFNFCDGQQVQAEPKIFYYDFLSTQSTLAAWSFILTGLFLIDRNIAVPSPTPPQGEFLRSLKFSLTVTCNTVERTGGKPPVEGVNWLWEIRAWYIHAGVDV